MSVVNTWMDMPDNCIVCPEREKTYCNAMKGSSIALDMKNKPNWCPFKSIDGLIEKLISSGYASPDGLIVKMIREYFEMDKILKTPFEENKKTNITELTNSL